MRVEAPKLVDNTYQQLLSNKDWVKQLTVCIAVTISFEQWLRVGVQKFVDATFRKFGDANASEEIRQNTFANDSISIYLFRQLIQRPNVSNKLALIPANAERGTKFLVRHNSSNQYTVVEARDGKFTYQGLTVVNELYSPVISWKEEDILSKTKKRKKPFVSGRTQQTLMGIQGMEEATPPPRPFLSQPQPMRPRTK